MLYDLIIIGGGPAGIAAAVEAYHQGIQHIILIEREKELGGILQQCIHNGFGIHEFNEELTGPSFAQRFIDLVDSYQIPYLLETTVTQITEDKAVTFISQKGEQTIYGKSILLAMGCKERARGSISIPGTRPVGVMSAGCAQKYLNIEGCMVGKRVFILGSGDIGLIMARRMHLEGATVVGVAEIMPYSNGLTRNIVQCLDDFNIPLYLSSTVAEIIGKNRLEAIRLCQVSDQLQIIEETSQIIQVDLLLLSIGLIPDNVMSEHLSMEMCKQTKGAIVNNHYQTSIAGIFACGNVLHVHDVVDYVVEEARLAVKGIKQYLLKSKSRDKLVKVSLGNGIRYMIPHLIDVTTIDDNQSFYFRVSERNKEVKIVIYSNNKVIKTITKRYVHPSKMEKIQVEKHLLSQCDSSIFITMEE